MSVKPLLIGLTLLLALPLFSQQKKEVKVGLVLSGGGAKGLAHIGVLEVIDEAGIQIDYIAGTSMGAIIGGLYASGYSAKELDSIFKTIHFETLIQDNLPRNAKTFYEKNDSEKYVITLPFDHFKITLPSSLSRGQNVYNLFSRLTEHVNHIEDFSELPIPFFCIATDIETGKPVKLDRGYLPQVMRASGSLPSIFSPIEIDNKILIDGGVVDNYPITLLREKGVDIVIGVDVQDTLQSRENLRSAFDILTQISNYRTYNDMVEKRTLTDIYIQPDISSFSVVSFGRGEEIIQSGRERALMFKDALDSIARLQNRPLREPIQKHRSDSLFIDDIHVMNNKFYTRSYILGKLKLKEPFNTTYVKLSEGLNNLAATGNFNQIDYYFKKNHAGNNELYFNIYENQNKTFLRLALHYDDLYKTAALINITRKNLFQRSDVAAFDFIVGDNLRYNFDYYVDKGFHLSYGVHSSLNKFKRNVPFALFPSLITEGYSSDISSIQLKHQTLTNQFYVQTLFQQIYLLGVGVEHKHILFDSETLAEESSDNRSVFENTNYFSLYGNLKLDNRDNKYFPTQGVFFEGKFNFYAFTTGLYANQDQFSIAKAQLGYAFQPLRRLAVTISTEGGVKIGKQQTSSLDFIVGGYGYLPVNNFVHLYGYDVASLRGDTYFKAKIRLDYEFYRKTYLSGVFNAANVGDRLFLNTGWINNKPHTGFGLGITSNTYIGPTGLFWSYSPETLKSQWYVSVGFWF